MSLINSDEEDTTIYKVVVNDEEQYSIWPKYKENPSGWRNVGKAATKAECLAYIKEVWRDMRPLSLRKKMEEIAANPKPRPSHSSVTREKSLVDRLCDGDHPVAVNLGTENSIERFR